MSVCSDDTDLLVLCPPDLFTVPDNPEISVVNVESYSGYFLEEEKIVDELIVNEDIMRRFGSADTLTPVSSASLRSRSLHTTPSKYGSPKKNLLTSESYIYQKGRDEECLREIDEYFKVRDNNGSSALAIPSLDLPQVNDFISQLEETERSLTEKSKSNEFIESANNIKTAENVRRLLKFDNLSESQKALDSLRAPTEQTKPFNTQLSIETSEPTMQKDNLLSLQNLWSSHISAPKLSTYEEMKILKQRLEEERLRRIHCEDVIRDLQKKLLESQEKMAVALKVDEEKDAAINKLKEGWSRSVEKWKDIELKYNELSQNYSEQQQLFNNEKESLTKTLKKYEQDLLKALNLVQDYNQEQKNGAKERDVIAMELVKVQEQLDIREKLNKSLNEKLKENEKTIETNSVRISELTSLCKDFKKQIKHCHNEKDRLMKEQEETKLLQSQIEEMSKKEIKLLDQLNVANKSKSDLKLYYQDQVDTIVSEKQKEFEIQLANLEKVLQKQFEVKEKNIIDAAGQEKQQLGENYKLEILVMEATHGEEVELYKMKLAHCNNKIDDLQNMLARQTDRQHELAEKLHSVIQTQWKETLKVISSSSNSEGINGSSPPKATLKRQNTFTKGDNALPILNGDRNAASSLKKTGSQTYRINETPQKISHQNNMKDLLDQIMHQKENSPDENASRLDISANSNINDTSGSSKEKYKLKSERMPWK